jgi:dethiobiotin synthetase
MSNLTEQFSKSRGLFVTGTSTEVGKTYVASLVARSLVATGKRTGVYKPVASGCDPKSDGSLVARDALALWVAAGQPGELNRVAPQRYAAPLAPHLAAREEGRQVDSQLLRKGIQYWLERSDIVVVEGAGGLMSPISDDEYNADLAADFGFPLVVVAPNVLGVINQTLQTIITASYEGHGLPIAGIVLNDVQELSANDPSTRFNRSELASRCLPPVLTGVAHHGGFDTEVDWFAVADK